MQPPTKGAYKGFRATGSMMTALAKVDPSVGGAVLILHVGFL